MSNTFLRPQLLRLRRYCRHGELFARYTQSTPPESGGVNWALMAPGRWVFLISFPDSFSIKFSRFNLKYYSLYSHLLVLAFIFINVSPLFKNVVGVAYRPIERVYYQCA